MVGKKEKIKYVYGIHLPFWKFFVSHLFSLALLICSSVVPCFLQKILQENKLLFIIKIQKRIIQLKDAVDEKIIYSSISICNCNVCNKVLNNIFY